jgi:mono/diheme cytochrome c family protein
MSCLGNPRTETRTINVASLKSTLQAAIPRSRRHDRSIHRLENRTGFWVHGASISRSFSKTSSLPLRTASSIDVAFARCAAIALASMQPVPRIEPARRGKSKSDGFLTRTQQDVRRSRPPCVTTLDQQGPRPGAQQRLSSNASTVPVAAVVGYWLRSGKRFRRSRAGRRRQRQALHDCRWQADARTYNGFRRYHAGCNHCHGPDGVGSTFASSLVDRPLDIKAFRRVVREGQSNGASVMKGFGDDPNFAPYIDDIYAYLQARADGALGRGRPAGLQP